MPRQIKKTGNKTLIPKITFSLIRLLSVANCYSIVTRKPEFGFNNKTLPDGFNRNTG